MSTLAEQHVKAKKMREALGKLAGEYIVECRMRDSIAVQKVAAAIGEDGDTLARLYDLITK